VPEADCLNVQIMYGYSVCCHDAYRYVYIYIYRERKRAREIEREIEMYIYIHIYTDIYIYIYVRTFNKHIFPETNCLSASVYPGSRYMATHPDEQGDIGQASAAKPIDMQSLYILRGALFESGFDSVVLAQLWPPGPVFPFLLVDGLCETWTCKRAIYNHTRTPAPESG